MIKYEWLILTLPLVCSMHTMNITDVLCTNSPKKSSEITNCLVSGRYLSFDINFKRRLDDWNVS